MQLHPLSVISANGVVRTQVYVLMTEGVYVSSLARDREPRLGLTNTSKAVVARQKIALVSLQRANNSTQ